jgi:predicted nucleotidyltransferase component of viral defense system
MPDMDLKEIRRLVIIALFSDDELMEKLVLKGGNALDIVYGVGSRASLDIDLSIAQDFIDLKDTERRIFRSLTDRFDAAGYVIFDEKFGARPRKRKEGLSEVWGGYAIEFKLIDRDSFEKYKDDWSKLQKNAAPVAPNMSPKFKIEISKHEFVETKEEIELDDYTIYVYSLPMIVIEKLRAICQQMPEYHLRGYATARARDFYDIHSIVTAKEIDITTAENIDLINHIFEAKEVPLEFLGNIEQTREFHRENWQTVKESVSADLKNFDYYFEFVVQMTEELKASRII